MTQAASGVSGTHPITETSHKEGTQPGPGPAVNRENESVLQPVPLRNENQIILSLNLDQNFGESGYSEIVFRLLYIHHHTLCSERYPDPLLTMRLDPPRYKEHLLCRSRPYLLHLLLCP